MDPAGDEPRSDGPFLGFAGDENDDTPEPDSGRSKRRTKKGFVRRHKAISILAVLLVIALGTLAATGLLLNRQIGNIPRVPITVEGPRPAAPTNGSMNILLAGADNGDTGPSIATMAKSGTWVAGSHRSDTIMVLHLTADRKHAYLISVPRDTYTKIDGYGFQKINAAFSFGGPSLYLQTLEQFTGLRMEHLAIIDWNGFRDVSTALGGVRVYVSADSYDSARRIYWHKGYQTVSGNQALAYVRQRHGLPNGDFDRIQRQQNFLRSALQQMISSGTMADPVRFGKTLHAIASHLTLDSSFSNGDVRSLAWSLRHLRTRDITYITTPMKRFASTSVGSVVVPDLAKTRELFGDVATDDLADYVRRYGGAGELNGQGRVR